MTDADADDMALLLNRAELAKLKAETKLCQAESRLSTARAKCEEADWEATQALPNRHCVYTLWDAIYDETASRLVHQLGVWHRRSPGQPFELIINSPGGYVSAGLAMYDAIREFSALGHHVTTVGIGHVASMGGILLQAGDKRVMGRHSFMLIHEITMGHAGKVSEMEDSLAVAKLKQEALLAILAKRSRFSVKEVAARWKKMDWWLTAEQAVEHGFADTVRG